MNHPISEELEELSPEQEGSTLERNLDRPSTSGTNISGSITAHEEALETHPLLDGSTRRSKSDGKPLREKLTIEEKPAKRRSLSLLVHTGSVHTLKVSPKKRRTPQGNFSMAGIPPPVPTNPRPPSLDYNLFTTKQTIAQGLLLASLFMCNVSQLKTLVINGHQFQFYRFVTTFIIFSIVIEIFLGIILLFLGKDDLTDIYEQKRLDKLNNVAVFLAFIVVIFNVFVAAFGLMAA